MSAAAPSPPPSVAVLGAGTIGLFAAIRFALHGVETTVVARRPEAAAGVPQAAAVRLERLVALGAVDAARAAGARERLRAVVGLPAGERFALVFEAVAEDLAVKREVLAGAEDALADDGVLATTTSSLPVEELAAALRRPDRFAAWHWFHPADLMALVEVVPGSRTAADVVERLLAWSRALVRRPLALTRDTPGFVANRLQYALLREAYALVEAGICGLADVDTAVTAGLGPRWAAIGPFATMDLAGLGVHAAVTERLYGELATTTATPRTLTELRGQGAGGARAGRGLLGDYPPERCAELEARRDDSLVAAARRAR